MVGYGCRLLSLRATVYYDSRRLGNLWLAVRNECKYEEARKMSIKFAKIFAMSPVRE